MATVIDAISLVRNNKRLPKEAFFVDTNVVLDFVDPFGKSLGGGSFGKRNERVTEVTKRLKSDGVPCHSTVGIALEYYKHIQVGFYQAHTGNKFEPEDFKVLRKANPVFASSWNLQIKMFSKTFSKTFPLKDVTIPATNVLKTFDCTNVDFGDHVLYVSVKAMDEKNWCVFSNDSDFYSFADDLVVLTTNSRIIEKARADGHLLQL